MKPYTTIIKLLTLALAISCGSQVHAQYIALETNYPPENRDYVTIDVAGELPSTNTTFVPYLPFFTPTIISLGPTAQMTPTLTGNELSYAYALTSPSLQAYSLGSGGLYFQALSNAQYSIIGGVNITGSGHAEIEGTLTDVSTDTTEYSSYDSNVTAGSGGAGQAFLPSSQGNLIAGHQYAFVSYVDASDVAVASGGVTITFSAATPEPSTLALMFGGMGMLGLYFFRKTAAKR